MAFVPVVSAALTAVHYEREQQRLVVQFGESWYEYDHVPGDVVLDVMFADSIGSTFDRLIKKGGFSFRKIPSAEALNT